MRDEEILPERVLKLAQRTRTEDVVLQFAKYEIHVMDQEEDLERMWSAVFELTVISRTTSRHLEASVTSGKSRYIVPSVGTRGNRPQMNG